MEIQGGSAGVPDAAGVTNAVTSVSQTATGGAHNGQPSLTITGAAGTATAGATRSSTGGVPAKTAGWIGAAVAAGGVVLAL
jgi:hypothetical protein